MSLITDLIERLRTEADGYKGNRSKRSVRVKHLMTNQEQYELICEKAKKYDRLVVVLDKIRAEIENHCGLVKENHCKYCSYCNSVMGVREILEIIDKYKSESEE